MPEKLLTIVNTVRENKGLEPMAELKPEQDLRTNLGFDSLDLAELTVRIEKEFGIDVFADSFVLTVGDIIGKITK
jgi:acyl carrier protein